MPHELEEYLQELQNTTDARERDYAATCWDALEDKIGSAWPLLDDYGISFHRSVEIVGVVEYYHGHLVADRRAAANVVTIEG